MKREIKRKITSDELKKEPDLTAASGNSTEFKRAEKKNKKDQVSGIRIKSGGMSREEWGTKQIL